MAGARRQKGLSAIEEAFFAEIAPHKPNELPRGHQKFLPQKEAADAEENVAVRWQG